MDIKYGSVEYFQLESLYDKLKWWGYDKYDLLFLDKLRMELQLKIKAIEHEHINRIRKTGNN